MSRYDLDEYDDEAPLDEEALIENVLGEDLRANELRVLRTTLEARRRSLRQDWQNATEEKERERLATRLKEMTKQIAALREEEAINGFIETSVRFTLHNPAQDELQ